MIERTIQDLNYKELLEDLNYWAYYAQMQSPDFVDATFEIIYKYINELEDRLVEEDEMSSL